MSLGLTHGLKKERERERALVNILDPGKKVSKKIAKKFRKLKKPFPALFLAKTGRDKPRKVEKIFVPNFIHTQPG